MTIDDDDEQSNQHTASCIATFLVILKKERNKHLILKTDTRRQRLYKQEDTQQKTHKNKHLKMIHTSSLQVIAACLVASTSLSEAFLLPNQRVVNRVTLLQAEKESSETSATATASKPKVKQLGLLTFDLDDTLYPIAPVVDDANCT